MEVIKIGGSIITNRKKFKLVSDYINNYKSKLHIVISAFDRTSYKLSKSIEFALSNNLNNSFELLQEIKDFHSDLDASSTGIIDEIFNSLKKELEAVNILRECNESTYDSILSKGEELAAKALINNLNKGIEVDFMDAKDFIICDSEKKPIINKIKNSNYFQKHDNSIIKVTQGFIGVNESKKVVTMGFESSTLSALILAIVYGSKEFIIISDVPGIRQIDPKLVKEFPLLIKNISYSDAILASKAGIKLLPENLIELASKYEVKLIFKSLESEEQSVISLTDSDKNTLIIVNNDKVHLINVGTENLKELIDMNGVNRLEIDKLNSTALIDLDQNFDINKIHLFFRS